MTTEHTERDAAAGEETIVEQTAAATADAAPDSEPGSDGHTHHGYMSDKQRYLARLRRIEGQARGIHKMIDEEKYCIDILTQISALNSALRNVGLGLLDDHLKHCVLDAAQAGGEEADAKLEEASQAIARFMKS